ncbi:MAG: XrtA/PEP-CTERM system-associated ATPase [Pseudomonadota bacterium]
MYDKFYGFTGRPFQLTPDPAFYFESLTHRKALSYLGYGLAQGEGFVVITGEIGAGKSTLVAHLMATIDPARLTAAQVVTSALTGDELIHVVAQAFGLMIDGHDKASALSAIEGLFHAEARAGRRCLLVVDEGQNLSVEALEELRMLSNFQLGAQPLLQTLLLGQPEFRELILTSPELEQLRQRVIAAHHLEGMEPDEVQPYVEHRLKRVGWAGRPAFAADIFAELHRVSGGMPRKINQIVSRVLLLGAVEQLDHIDGDAFSRVLAELATDSALPLARLQPEGRAVAEPAANLPPIPPGGGVEPEADRSPAGGLTGDEIRSALAERDNQLAELQQALIELANHVERQPDASAVAKRLGELETRMVEQEATVKHTLAMLIEWLESDQQSAA